MLAVSFVHAQANFQGIAEYESKISLEFDFHCATPEQEAKQQEKLKKALQKKYTLKFDNIQSLYEEQETLSEPDPSGTAVEIEYPGTGTTYRNFKERRFIAETDIFGKEFLIVDTLKGYTWDMTGETKKIGAYNCYKATYTVRAKPREENEENPKAINILEDIEEESYVITAWYTPDIPLNTGPGYYWGLPGLILEVNDGTMALLCSKVIINPKEKVEITPPKKGEKVTEAEFNEIREKKSMQMMDMHRPAPGKERKGN